MKPGNRRPRAGTEDTVGIYAEALLDRLDRRAAGTESEKCAALLTVVGETLHIAGCQGGCGAVASRALELQELSSE